MQELIDTLKELQIQLNIPIIVLDICENQLDIEKEQICNAYNNGLIASYLGSGQYYNETYKNK